MKREGIKSLGKGYICYRNILSDLSMLGLAKHPQLCFTKYVLFTLVPAQTGILYSGSIPGIYSQLDMLEIGLTENCVLIFFISTIMVKFNL